MLPAANPVDGQHPNVGITLPVDALVLDLTHFSTGNVENA